MHNTRRELLDDFVRFVGDANDDEARNVAEGVLNRALTKIWMTLPWRVFRSPAPYELTLTVNQPSYALPDYFGRIGPGEARNATRGTELPRLQDGELEKLFPFAGTSLEAPGVPARYEITGTCGVHTQPAITGDELEAVSSDSADVDVMVAIGGDDADGNWTRAEVTLNGTTPVSLGTWSFVDEFGKSFTAGTDAPTEFTTSRGTVTLRKVVGQDEIQKLFSQESARQHDIFTVYPKPESADTLFLPVIRKPKRVFTDADPVPDLWGPAIFEEMMLEWQVNIGELSAVAALNAPRPRLLDLISYENQQKGRPRKRMFGLG